MSTDPYAFFVVSWHSATQSCATPWRPMSELGNASPAWAERIAATRAALASAGNLPVADVEYRVAASVVHLGVCARIIAAALAGAADGVAIDADLSRMWWQPIIGGPFPLSVQRLSDGRITATQLSTMLRESLIEVTMRNLVLAVREYSVSPVIAWGNVASALHSAADMLAAARPEQAAETRALVDSIATGGPLAGTRRSTPGDAFRRNSCCLIYRVAGAVRGGVCGDCILGDHHTSPSRQSQVISASTSSGAADSST